MDSPLRDIVVATARHPGPRPTECGGAHDTLQTHSLLQNRAEPPAMNQISFFGRFATAFAVLCLCTAARSDVVYVDASGSGQYTTIQPAVDAAVDGDVILVRSGTYPGFTIDQRRVFVIAD